MYPMLNSFESWLINYKCVLGGQSNFRVTNMTEWGDVSFQNGRLQTRLRLMCRSGVPISEMDEDQIEKHCYVLKINVRYCKQNGKCGKKLGGLRKVFEYMEPRDWGEVRKVTERVEI